MFIQKSEFEKLKNDNTALQAIVDSSITALNTLRKAFSLADDATEQEITDHAAQLISENNVLNAAVTEMETTHTAAIEKLNEDLQAANARITELESGDADTQTIVGKDKDKIQDINTDGDPSKFAHNKAADKYFGKEE